MIIKSPQPEAAHDHSNVGPAGYQTELLTGAEMTRADQLAVAAGIPSPKLMESAGQAVAEAAGRLATAGTRVAVLCGPGNNGGDGFVAARLLKERGFGVRLALLGPLSALKGDAAAMAARWEGSIEELNSASHDGAGLIIDALFGAGLSRAIDGTVAAVVAAVNSSGRPVLAVDVPSGLDGTAGGPAGPVVKATHTITFFRKKPGHVLMPGRMLCGFVHVADIGIPASVLSEINPMTHENTPSLWLPQFPWPKPDGHKYHRGHAVVVSGSAETSGAARLGARGALRIGAGLVTLIGNAAATAINAAHTNAVMVRRVEGTEGLAEFLQDKRRNAVLIGPGASVGEETAGDVLAILASEARTVLDADALSSFVIETSSALEQRTGFGFLRSVHASARAPAALYDAIKSRTAPVVLTPHGGEFRRLFGELAGSKLDQARAAAKMSGAVIVFKGSDTIIAHPDGRAAINANAPPWLATAGSGDVLAGFIAGLLAQGMPAFEAASAAVWLHGECANVFGLGLIADDLPEVLPRVLSRLHGLG